VFAEEVEQRVFTFEEEGPSAFIDLVRGEVGMREGSKLSVEPLIQIEINVA
jgi:hypothetical protein